MTAPTTGDAVTLQNCADEPIHLPGSIQPHGVLVAVDDGGLVAVASQNATAWFGLPAEGCLGRPVGDVLGPLAEPVAPALTKATAGAVEELPLELAGGEPVLVSVYRSGSLTVMELERDGDEALAGAATRAATMAINQATSVIATAEAAATALRQVTGFDRVMVYRFDAGWNGEVIAEAKREDLNTFLGLHYPHTDIPAQARELYRRNWLRIIPDVAYRPVPLVGPAESPPLDLSDSTIRSVSPIHIEYLGNMGVTASMSVSIIVDGDLWGLVACHHYSGPHRPSPALRSAAVFLGQLVSVRIRETQAHDDRQRAADLVALATSLADALLADDQRPLRELLLLHEADVLKLTDATGAIISFGGEQVTLGLTPPPVAAMAALADLRSAAEDTVALAHAGAVSERFAPWADTAAGVLAVSLSGDRHDLAVWFRPEQVRLVDWAGDPYAKERAAESPAARLSPRRSFDLWREVVRGQARPWARPEIGAAQRFVRHLGAAILRRSRDVEQLANDLQQIMLPRELPAIPGHELDAHYAPDGSGRVGGDWYDVVRLDGHTALVVGDVAGHGLSAAAAMGQARNALRAYLVDDPSPAQALERLDRLVRGLMGEDVMTLALAVLDHGSGSIELALAGHLPALRVTATGTELVAAPSNRLVGVHPGGFRSTRVDLAEGDLLVLYSDGLVETRADSLDDRLDLVRRWAFELRDEPIEQWTARLTAAMSDVARADDVTALVVRRLPLT